MPVTRLQLRRYQAEIHVNVQSQTKQPPTKEPLSCMPITKLHRQRNLTNGAAKFQDKKAPLKQESLSIPLQHGANRSGVTVKVKVEPPASQESLSSVGIVQHELILPSQTAMASRFFKWRADDEQLPLKTALMQQDNPMIRLLKDNDISVRQRAPSYRVVSCKVDPLIKYESEKSTPSMNEVRCLECVKVVPVSSCDDLEPGDHVIFCGTVYDHHGILLSKDGESLEIIEATNTFSGFITGILRGFWGKANIWITKKKFDFEKKIVCVVEYKYRYAKTKTIQRALDLHSDIKKTGNYSYNLLGNNCEHFATLCATGIKFSVQVSKFTLMWDMFLKTGFLGFNDELARNKAEFEKHLICKDCYDMNKHLLGVSVKPIVSAEDITKGDIIRYSYWNFWHEAVVLKKNEKKQADPNIVSCLIAHYAFFGPCCYRTIIDEEIKIRLDGQTFKLDYNQQHYNVYQPDEVVDRALRRIGEQLFTFYSNDSSHFVRWCKLKLLIPMSKLHHSKKKLGIVD